ncbi:MAG: ABC transporter permease, partial [Chloroflexota bacterium]|nr:ABC transporter permease [Chloroflexota bacterium]
MSLPELLRLALSRLRTSRLRSALTMLGVVIGVAAVVALVGVGQGTTSDITRRLSALGTNLLTVNPGAARTGNTVGAAGSRTNLTTADAAALAALPTIAGVAPEVTTQALVAAGTANSTTSIVGTTPDYLRVRAFEIAQGSFLPEVSVEQRLRVAVLGATTATDLG